MTDDTTANMPIVGQSIARIDMMNTDKASSGAGDRDQVIMDHIIRRDGLADNASAYLGRPDPVHRTKMSYFDIPWADTSKFRVAMIVAPAWGILLPPYNIAKLSGLMRKNGYSVKVYDLNVRSYHHLLEEKGEDYWRSDRYFLWASRDNFNTHLLPHLKSMFDDAIDDIIRSDPKVIGFSVYNTNRYATEYIMGRLREALPNTCIVVGGPEVSTNSTFLEGLPCNYVFVGEAEEKLLSTLEDLGKKHPIRRLVGSVNSRLNLDMFAYADYSDYDLSDYLHRDGVSIETSRGCIAQCSFCSETYFWKFRSMTPDRVVDEMLHQIREHGAKRFWFVDSLVNGNLKNFERLVDLMIERGLDINWNSYARCDGRMDRALMDKVANSGCTLLSYGVESGSQKVLNDMRKKIEIYEIENNLRDSNAAGIHNHVNWIVGFPTEEPLDFLHSLQLLYNCRRWINSISPGFTAGPAEASHMDTHWQTYGIQWRKTPWDNKFLDNWYTAGYRNTILHRFIRLKMLHIWLEIMYRDDDSILGNAQRYDRINEFFTFEAVWTKGVNHIDHVTHVRVDRVDGGKISDTVINEYMSFMYALHMYFGQCEMEIRFDRDLDREIFGNFLTCMYDSKVRFKVADDGDYSMEIRHKLVHGTDDPSLQDQYARERDREDMGFEVMFSETGNINDWMSSEDQTKDSVHAMYKRSIDTGNAKASLPAMPNKPVNRTMVNVPMANPRSTICTIPWHHIGIQQNGDYRMCCQMVHQPYGKLADGEGGHMNVLRHTMDDARNHDTMREVRRSMIQGKRHTLCRLCYEEEDAGLPSRRITTNDRVSQPHMERMLTETAPDGSIDTDAFPLTYYDIRFGNLCNLKCRSCGPSDSSMWYEDYFRLVNPSNGVAPFWHYSSDGLTRYSITKSDNMHVFNLPEEFEWYYHEEFWDQFRSNIRNVETIYLTGGEPTINKAHFRLLKLCIDEGVAGNINLEYNSNMWAIPDHLHDLWKPFGHVTVGCSVDGKDHMANYLRPPSTWDRLERNLDRLGYSDAANISASIATTISVYNVLHFIDLTKWLTGKMYPRMDDIPLFHMLHSPDYLNVQVLPRHIKDMITMRYEEFYGEIESSNGRDWADLVRGKLSGITTFMNANDLSDHLGDLKRITDRLDGMRGQRLSDAVPWLHDALRFVK